MHVQAGATRFVFYGPRGYGPSSIALFEKARSLGLDVELLPWNFEHTVDDTHGSHDYEQRLSIQVRRATHRDAGSHQGWITFPVGPASSLSTEQVVGTCACEYADVIMM